MSLLRHYKMIASQGNGDALKYVLTALAGKVAPLEGCEGVQLFRCPDQSETFIFIEHWATRDAHKAAGAALGKEAFAPIAPLLAAPPEALYLESALP